MRFRYECDRKHNSEDFCYERFEEKKPENLHILQQRMIGS